MTQRRPLRRFKAPLWSSARLVQLTRHLKDKIRPPASLSQGIRSGWIRDANAVRGTSNRHSDVNDTPHLRNLEVREEAWRDPAVGTGSQ